MTTVFFEIRINTTLTQTLRDKWLRIRDGFHDKCRKVHKSQVKPMK